MNSAEQFSRTIQSIYAAATDASLWPEALQNVEDLTCSSGAVLGLVPKRDGDIGFNLAGRFTNEQCAEYTATYQPICPRTSYVIRNPGLPAYYDAQIGFESDCRDDPVYDWFGQQGVRYFVAAGLPETPLYQPIFSLQRSFEQGHVQRGDLELFDLVKPHLGQAISLADRLGSLTTQEEVGLHALEALPQAVFGLSSDGTVVFYNSKAEAIVRDGDGITLARRALLTPRISDQAKLDALVRKAASPALEGAGGWMRLERPSSKPPYAVFVSHLHSSSLPLSNPPPRVLVMIVDPSRPIEPNPEALRKVFGLTEAESRAATLVGRGHDAESAADLLGISVQTFRTQLKAVFRKLEVSRQQDLVRVLGWLQTP